MEKKIATILNIYYEKAVGKITYSISVKAL